ncbi:MAG TPA: hypothetical protein VFG78_09650 [Gemmatimonadota bacterium]|nr:hypothetical protein [Gemmatimonadota bacterium]
MPCRRPVLAWVALLLVAGCASGSLRDAKNAYNRGDFAAARSSAGRLSDDPQARLIAARAGARLLGEDERAGSAALAVVAVDLRAAARGYPFREEWANQELAAGFADWLMRVGLPELADLYYRAGLEAAGDDPEPAEQALAEGALQAGLESLDRWEWEPDEREDRLRDLERLAESALDDSGLPYPPGLADQALRIAWHDGRFRDAWRVGAAGWLRATAMDDHGADLLASRLEDLVFPTWREAGGPAVDLVVEEWRRAMRSWEGAAALAGAGPGGS